MTSQGVAEMAWDLWVPLEVRPQWGGLPGESQLGTSICVSPGDLRPTKCRLSPSARRLVLLFHSFLNSLCRKAEICSDLGWIRRIVRKMKWGFVVWEEMEALLPFPTRGLCR